MEDWNKGDEHACLLSLLLDAWVKRVPKEKAGRAKNNHTVKMILKKEHRTRVLKWTRGKLARDFKRRLLWNALFIPVPGNREKAAIGSLDKCEVGSQMISQHAICWSGSERKYSKSTRTSPATVGCKEATAASTKSAPGLTGKAPWTRRELKAAKVLTMMKTRTNQLRHLSLPFWPTTCRRGRNQRSWKHLQQSQNQKEKKEPRRVGNPPLFFGEVIQTHPQGCYSRTSPFQHDH